MDILHNFEKICKEYYHCFKHCSLCDHRNDKHFANCIECCPVRNGKIEGEGKELKNERNE